MSPSLHCLIPACGGLNVCFAAAVSQLLLCSWLSLAFTPVMSIPKMQLLCQSLVGKDRRVSLRDTEIKHLD